MWRPHPALVALPHVLQSSVCMYCCSFVCLIVRLDRNVVYHGIMKIAKRYVWCQRRMM